MKPGGHNPMGPNTALERVEDAPKDERRDMQRIFPSGPIQGQLRLQVGNQTLSISRLRDVSPFGLGVEAPQAAAPGADARLLYERAGERLELKGTVLWARTSLGGGESPESSYQLGIKLDPSEVANNLRFYRYFTTP